MKLKTLALTVAVLAVLAALAFYLDRPAAPAAADPRVGAPVVRPADLAAAARLTLTEGGRTVTLTQADARWRVTSYHGLPADSAKLTRFVSDLTSATIRRRVGASAASLDRLGFADTRITVADAAGQEVLALTLGKTAEGGGRFVRYGTEDAAYLATLSAWLDLEPKNWADSTLVNVPADSVARLELGFTDPATPPVIVTRSTKDAAWQAESGAPDPSHPLQTAKLDSVLSALTSLRFSDTSAPDAPEAAAARAAARTVKLTTFDGATVTYVLGRRPEQKIFKEPTPAAKAADPLVNVADLAAGAAPTPADPTTVIAPSAEVVPAGPVFAFVTHSDAAHPVNALTAARAPQIFEWTFTNLPATPADLFTAPATATTPPVAAEPAPEPPPAP